MCGIAGFFGYGSVSDAAIEQTLRLMKNRGPDHQGFTLFDGGGRQCALLHSRLSIIDLDDRSHQPFTIGQHTLVFNGEIYNYKELRRKLEQHDVVFRTESDTEVLLQAFLHYGDTCVDHFEGMWSFAIFDDGNKSLFLSRDRFAEKPLYYVQGDCGIYFGSEIKFIKALSEKDYPINRRQVLRYLVNGYKSLYKQDETFFTGIREVPYATNMYIGRELRCSSKRYWHPMYQPIAMSPDEAVRGVRERLVDSMGIRLRSDVPLAFCLSGGVDSAALASIAKKEFKYDVTAFSILDRDERYNEYDNIMATVDDLQCAHTLIELSFDGTLEKLKELVRYHDAPVATISYLVHSYLSEAIAERGYKVAVSGTAADELFTGYYDHFNLHLYEMHGKPDYQTYLQEWKNGTGKHVRNPYLKNPELYIGNPAMRDHIYLNQKEFEESLRLEFHEEFTEECYHESLLRNRMLNEMFHEVVPVILHEDDLNSMFYSIENRSPYLDRRLFEFAYSIPSDYLIRNGYAKFVLREAVRGILNDTVRLDRQKKGFNASLRSVVDFSDSETIRNLLSDNPVYDMVDRERVANLFAMKELPNSYSKFLFNVINTKIFFDVN